MRLRSLLIALGVVSFAATKMAAQTCVGAASYSSGPVRLGAGFATTDGAKSYGVTLGVGAKAGAFGSASVSRGEYSDIDASSTGVSLGVGYAMDIDPAVQFCPVASFIHQSGPDIDFGSGTVTTTSHAFGLGGALGGLVPVTPTLDLVPFVSAAFLASHGSATYQGDTQSDSQNSGEIDLGAGFVINKTLTLQPAVAIPVGVDGAKSTFLLAFAFNFGGPPKH